MDTPWILSCIRPFLTGPDRRQLAAASRQYWLDYRKHKSFLIVNLDHKGSYIKERPGFLDRDDVNGILITQRDVFYYREIDPRCLTLTSNQRRLFRIRYLGGLIEEHPRLRWVQYELWMGYSPTRIRTSVDPWFAARGFAFRSTTCDRVFTQRLRWERG